jgi:hypothetical protein
MYCQYCGAQLDSGDRFCTNCGKRVQAQSFYAAPNRVDTPNPPIPAPNSSIYNNDDKEKSSKINVILTFMLFLFAFYMPMFSIIMSAITAIYSFMTKEPKVFRLSLCALALAVFIIFFEKYSLGYPFSYLIKKFFRRIFS